MPCWPPADVVLVDELAHTNVPGSGVTRRDGRTSSNFSSPVSTW